MANNSDITSSLITYGLISAENKAALEAWFEELFSQVREGGGGELVASSIVGRSFTFANGMSAQDAFNAVARALTTLNGRSVQRTIARF